MAATRAAMTERLFALVIELRRFRRRLRALDRGDVLLREIVKRHHAPIAFTMAFGLWKKRLLFWVFGHLFQSYSQPA
jgi:hypothetical protein